MRVFAFALLLIAMPAGAFDPDLRASVEASMNADPRVVEVAWDIDRKGRPMAVLSVDRTKLMAPYLLNQAQYRLQVAPMDTVGEDDQGLWHTLALDRDRLDAIARTLATALDVVRRYCPDSLWSR